MSPEAVGGVLLAAAEEWQRRLDALLTERHGLSWPQYLLLRTLAAGPPLSQTQLAVRLGRSKANLTAMLQRLEAEGFVVRLPEQDDGRVRRVALGRRADCLEAVAADVAAYAAARLASLTDDQRRTLGRLLQRLLAEGPGAAGDGERAVSDPPAMGWRAGAGPLAPPVQAPDRSAAAAAETVAPGGAQNVPQDAAAAGGEWLCAAPAGPAAAPARPAAAQEGTAVAAQPAPAAPPVAAARASPPGVLLLPAERPRFLRLNAPGGRSTPPG